ncbi:uncharacterized protein F5Z01DRAFT_442758 [Emericellopsis atlantica]|uniref:Uncharacterized protein n=1 Tax=Emericellopsis atlantica TaxID=2614577 RepID=A0A9P8CS33_9HYPO|nr:uncharacterized protein F5Z01DRAFT_442758 [Emericellopsis atlantica]KAG9256962.1 hypothetical protein F5Z01DRAFT_442758 [Emericellopsis atlantica]
MSFVAMSRSPEIDGNEMADMRPNISPLSSPLTPLSTMFGRWSETPQTPTGDSQDFFGSSQNDEIIYVQSDVMTQSDEANESQNDSQEETGAEDKEDRDILGERELSSKIDDPEFPAYNGKTQEDYITYTCLEEMWENVRDYLSREERDTFFALVPMSNKCKTTSVLYAHRIHRAIVVDPSTFNCAHYLVLRVMFGLEACMRQSWWSIFKKKYPQQAAEDEAAAAEKKEAERMASRTPSSTAKAASTLRTPRSMSKLHLTSKIIQGTGSPIQRSSQARPIGRRLSLDIFGANRYTSLTPSFSTRRSSYTPARANRLLNLRGQETKPQTQTNTTDVAELQARVSQLELENAESVARVRELEEALDSFRLFAAEMSTLLDPTPEQQD